MNKEKLNLDKPKKEAKKHERKSISLINELKIDKEQKEKDLLSEEIESYYWKRIYQEKLDKIKDDKDFEKAAIDDLEDDISQGKNGDNSNANWALMSILSYKNLEIFEKKAEEKLKEIKGDKDFKKSAFDDLENDINKGKNRDGVNANLALWIISSIKNISNYWQDLAQEKRSQMARKTQKQDIPKRPEIR